jgi:RNA polymerase sigma factor (sigma-70 family)
VGLVRTGDDRAFELLYERHGARVCAYVGGMVRDRGLAEDLTQEIFMSALRRMRETERPIAFRPWGHGIARNARIDQFRRTRRMEEVSYDGDDRLADPNGQGSISGFAAPDDAFEAKKPVTATEKQEALDVSDAVSKVKASDPADLPDLGSDGRSDDDESDGGHIGNKRERKSGGDRDK